MAGFVGSGFGSRPSAWRRLTPNAAPAPVIDSGASPQVAPDLLATIQRLEAELGRERAELVKARIDAEQARASFEENRGEAERMDAAEIERVREAAAELVRMRQRLVEEVRGALGELILAGARRLAGEALQAQPGLLEGMVEEVVAALGAEGLQLRVRPEDAERVARIVEAHGIVVVADPSVDGGVHASSPGGAVDATLVTGTTALRAVTDQWRSAGWRDEGVP